MSRYSSAVEKKVQKMHFIKFLYSYLHSVYLCILHQHSSLPGLTPHADAPQFTSHPPHIMAQQTAETEVESWIDIVKQKVSALRFGSVQIIVHEGRVTQVESTEKTRLASEPLVAQVKK